MPKMLISIILLLIPLYVYASSGGIYQDMDFLLNDPVRQASLISSEWGSMIASSNSSGASSGSTMKEAGRVYLSPDFSYTIPVSVAILPFSNDTGDKDLDWLSNGIPEASIPKFIASSRIRLIDKTLISEILEELGFSASDLADSTKAIEVGKLIAARIMIRGSYQKMPGGVLKIIWGFTDVQTGTIVKADEETGSQRNMDELMDQVGRKLVQGIDPDVRIKARPPRRSRSLYPVGIGGKLALVLPAEEAGTTLGMGVVADLGDLTEQLNLEASVEYWRDSSEVLGIDWVWSAITFGGMAKYHIPVSKWLSPFAGGGIGLTISRSEYKVPIVTDVAISESGTDVSFHLVGGIDVSIVRGMKFTLEVKHALDGINVTWLTGAVLFRLQ